MGLIKFENYSMGRYLRLCGLRIMGLVEKAIPARNMAGDRAYDARIKLKRLYTQSRITFCSIQRPLLQRIK
jgi:hypothetical protein